MARFFERYDFLVMPTAQVFPFDARETWPREIAGQTMRTYHEWMKAVCLVSMAGCPSLAVPAGFNAQGLPMGLQIVAPIHRDVDCLRMGFAYEQARPWIGKLPPLLLA
jgi:amidase